MLPPFTCPFTAVSNKAQENTPERFVWEGNLYNLFYGRHFFDFAPSKKNPGGTTFIQTENFGGCLLVLAWPWRNKEFDMSNWHSFNEALKNEAEKSTSQI